MSGGADVSLKEHLEAVQAERDRALNIREQEVARRLDELNHAHRQQMERDKEYVKTVAFDDLARRVAELELFRRETQGRTEQRTTGSKDNKWVIGVVIAVAAIIISVLQKLPI